MDRLKIACSPLLLFWLLQQDFTMISWFMFLLHMRESLPLLQLLYYSNLAQRMSNDNQDPVASNACKEHWLNHYFYIFAHCSYLGRHMVVLI